MKEKTIRDFKCALQYLSRNISGLSCTSGFTNGYLGIIGPFWSVVFADEYYALLSKSHTDIRISSDDRLAAEYVYWLVLAKEYNSVEILDPVSLKQTLASRAFKTEIQFCIETLIDKISAAYILVRGSDGSYGMDFGDRWINIDDSTLIIRTLEDKQRLWTLPLADDFWDNDYLKDIIAVPRVKPAMPEPTACFTKPEKVDRTSKPSVKQHIYNFEFDLNAKIPVSVKETDYAAAAQEALNRIKQTLAGVDYEITNSKFKGQTDEA